MKPALLCALMLATAALGTSCCSTDNDLVTIIGDNSAGMHDENLFPSDCRQPQMLVPVGYVPGAYVPGGK